uniref:Secreted protein n=1 Tax=Panagrellus redivivus TaxID=6233 RepID=A0A7E4VZ34_PANRE
MRRTAFAAGSLFAHPFPRSQLESPGRCLKLFARPLPKLVPRIRPRSPMMSSSKAPTPPDDNSPLAAVLFQLWKLCILL